MPNLQFSVPSDIYLALVERGAAYGLSEHLVAKYLVLHGLSAGVRDEALLLVQREAAQTRAAALRTKRTVRPIGG